MSWRVSTLLGLAGLVDPWWFTAESRERGHTVHAIGEQILRQLGVDVSPDYEGYKLALMHGVLILKIQPICIERRLQDGIKNGRPDVIGWIPEAVGAVPAGPVIVDIKSGERAPTHALQLEFYRQLADATPDLRNSLPEQFRNLPWQRIGFYVRPNGTYKFHLYDDPLDYFICNAIVDLIAWRAANGLIEAEQSYSYADDPSFPLEPTVGG